MSLHENGIKSILKTPIKSKQNFQITLLVLILLVLVFPYLLKAYNGYLEKKEQKKYRGIQEKQIAIPTTKVLELSEETEIVPIATIKEPYLGFNYDCREDKLSIIKDSFNSYNQSINTQNICFENLQKTHESCTAQCNPYIENICNSDSMSKSMGYSDKKSCYYGEDLKFQTCLSDCTYFSNEERRRCNDIVSTAKDDMNVLLKKYCEISLK